MIEWVIAGLLQTAANIAAPPVPLPRWLAGCWMAEGAEGRTEECWTLPRGNMILGSSHTFSQRLDAPHSEPMSDASRTLWFEHMRIVAENGRLAYIAQPGGAAPTRFVARTMTSNNGVETLEFINEANDYPQRITYRYNHARHWELTAEISMLNGSRMRSWEFRRPRQ
jgi:hypothetical protein